jgi:hypothetical protein
MSWHVNECAWCSKLTEGAAYYCTDAPRNPSGTIERDYANGNPPRFCCEDCRSAYEATRAIHAGEPTCQYCGIPRAFHGSWHSFEVAS